MIAVVAGLFGLVIGSFLNVVIHRVPLRRSVVWPSSECPFCGAHIKAFDNLPMLSYLILHGSRNSSGGGGESTGQVSRNPGGAGGGGRSTGGDNSGSGPAGGSAGGGGNGDLFNIGGSLPVL